MAIGNISLMLNKLSITEYFLIWLQPLELTYLYLHQKNYLMYMHYFLYLIGLVSTARFHIKTIIVYCLYE